MVSFAEKLLASPRLMLIFSKRHVKISNFFQELILQDKSNKYYLIIDINHNWTAADMSETTRIIQPNSLDELLEVITELDQIVSSRVKSIIIDGLPLYFRDFRNGDIYGMQNLRTYSFCLSVLRRLSREVPSIVSSFPNGLYPEQPLMFDISKYYCHEIYRLEHHQTYQLISL